MQFQQDLMHICSASALQVATRMNSRATDNEEAEAVVIEDKVAVEVVALRVRVASSSRLAKVVEREGALSTTRKNSPFFERDAGPCP